MIALLNWRVLVAIALAGLLAFSCLTFYRKGRHDVQTQWDAAIASANSEARHLEQARQDAADSAGRLAAAREAGIRADASRARGAVDGLRGDLDAIQRASKESLDAATKSVAALSDVFEQCSRQYSSLAEVADRHASDALTLQQSWPK